MTRTLWYSIREPRAQRLVFSIAYTLLACAGLSAIASPPSSIEGAIGPILTYIWGGFLAAGGVCGAVSLWPGTWWLEKVGLALGAGGAAVYAVVVLNLHLTASSGNRLPQFFIVAGLSLFFGLRAWEIRGLDSEPRR